MAQQKIAVIVNENAGLGTSHEGLGAKAAAVLTTNDLVYRTSTLADLDRATADIVRRIIAGEVQIVAPFGGDGSQKEALTRLLRLLMPIRHPLPPILPMPFGTMVMLATNIGLADVNVMDLVQQIADKVRMGEPLKTQTLYPLCVNGEYGFLFGIGSPANIIEWYNESAQRGPRRVLQLAGESFLDELAAAVTFTRSKQLLTRPVAATVTFPGRRPSHCRHHTHTTLMCAALNQIGLGCNGMPLARAKPGHFMLRSSQMSYWEYMRSLPAIWRGKPIPKTLDFVTPRAIIEYPEPTVAQFDGDLMMPSLSHEVSSGPAVTYIVG